MSSTVVTYENLIQAIEDSKRSIDICIPCTDYYRQRTDWDETTIEYISASDLIERLREMQNDCP